MKPRRRLPPPSPWLARAAAAAWLALAGPSATAANLGEIYRLALANDAQFAAAQHAAAGGRERRAQGRALLLPTVVLNASARRNRDESTAYSGDANYFAGNATLQLTQPLLRPANRAGAEQGDLQAQQADQQLRLAEQELMLRVAKGYFDVLQARDALATMGAQKEAFATQLAQAKRNFEVGLAPVTEVNEAQARYDLTLAQEIAARNELESKQRVLEKSINTALPPLDKLDEAAAVNNLVTEPRQQELAAVAAQGSVQVALALTAEKIAQAELRRQQAGHLPTVDLVGSLSHQHNANYGALGGQRITALGLGVDVAVPLYQGGAIESRVREAQHGVSKAASELDNARRQALLDARQALLGLRSGVALELALKQAIASGETQVRSTRRGLEVGVRTRVDVLNAEQQLFTTRRDWAASRYQSLVAGLQLRAAAGLLVPADLLALDALLKP